MERMEIRSAVVNGPLGTVGMALVRNLLEKGIETWAVCYPGDRRIENLPAGARIVECDMREIQRLPEKVSHADAFFHLAWMGTIGPGRNDTLLQTENVRCAVDAAKVAKQMSCQVFVGVGSQAEHGRIEGKVTSEAPCFPTTGYGIAKLCAGQMTRLECSHLGIRHVWARILSAYGPGDGPLSVIPSMLDKLLKGEKPALTKGEQLWDFCFSGDVAEALYCMAVSGKDGKIYPVLNCMEERRNVCSFAVLPNTMETEVEFAAQIDGCLMSQFVTQRLVRPHEQGADSCHQDQSNEKLLCLIRPESLCCGLVEAIPFLDIHRVVPGKRDHEQRSQC